MKLLRAGAPPAFDGLTSDECPTRHGLVDFLMDVLMNHGGVIPTRGSTDSCVPGHRSLSGAPTNAPPRGPEASLMLKTQNGGLQLAVRIVGTN